MGSCRKAHERLHEGYSLYIIFPQGREFVRHGQRYFGHDTDRIQTSVKGVSQNIKIKKKTEKPYKCRNMLTVNQRFLKENRCVHYTL